MDFVIDDDDQVPFLSPKVSFTEDEYRVFRVMRDADLFDKTWTVDAAFVLIRQMFEITAAALPATTPFPPTPPPDAAGLVGAGEEDVRVLSVAMMRDDLIRCCTATAKRARIEAGKIRNNRGDIAQTMVELLDAEAERCEFMAGRLAELFPPDASRAAQAARDGGEGDGS